MSGITDCSNHQGKGEFILIIQNNQRRKVTVPGSYECHDSLCYQRRYYQRQHQLVIYRKFFTAIHYSRLNQFIRQCAVYILLIEENREAIGYGRHHQRKIVVQKLHCLYFLIEADDTQLSRKHHRNQNHRKQEVLPFEVKFGKRVCGHHSEIVLNHRYRDCQQKAVDDSLI